jgi:hypothetical protein
MWTDMARAADSFFGAVIDHSSTLVRRSAA